MFKALGALNADGRLAKAQLVFKIDLILKERSLKQVETAARFDDGTMDAYRRALEECDY